MVRGGGYVEYAVAPAVQCLPVPDPMTYVEAATLPEVFFTVCSNVFDRANLQPGETFLVHGGSSGIAAIQLAKYFGAQVLTTAGSSKKYQFCLSLGADRAVNYRKEDFGEALKEETGGRGVDVILDMVGDEYIQRNIDIAAEDGRIVSIAFLQGADAYLNLNRLMMKRLTMTGSTLRARSSHFKAEIASALKAKVWPALENGEIQSKVYQVFPLAEASAAHLVMESSEHMGKLVLEIIPVV